MKILISDNEELNGNNGTTLDDLNDVVPQFVFDGEFFPPGYHVYFSYVYKFTRVSEDYTHLYIGDSSTLNK